VFVAFDSTATFFQTQKVRLAGTPIRPAFFETAGPQQGQKGEGIVHLVIFGGSQGAKAINGAVVSALPLLIDLRERLLITHQTGEADRHEVAQAYRERGFKADVEAFFFDMPTVLRRHDGR
jgi:UDP-N-acetylglucosamine--N-acetylmuramyl-(pentapeptide) pyrophosphoryl-undecaprenol N-acetylglucosamine transferase